MDLQTTRSGLQASSLVKEILQFNCEPSNYTLLYLTRRLMNVFCTIG